MTTRPFHTLQRALTRDDRHRRRRHGGDGQVDRIGMSRIVGYARTPWTAVAPGLTGYTGPVNPPSIELWKRTPPIVCRSRDAPTTAMAAGPRKRRARQPRRAPRDARTGPAPRASRGRDLDADDARPTADGDRGAALAKHLEHRSVLGQDDRLERGDAGLVGDLGETTQQAGPQPSALIVVGDGDRELGTRGVEAVVARLADDPVIGALDGHQRDAASRRTGRPIVERSPSTSGAAVANRMCRDQPLNRSKAADGRLVRGRGEPDMDGRAVEGRHRSPGVPGRRAWVRRSWRCLRAQRAHHGLYGKNGSCDDGSSRRSSVDHWTSL